MPKNILEKHIDDISKCLANHVDYEFAWMVGEKINNPTTYSGKGRPKKTDYLLVKHPFDGKINKSISY